ncbi:MAG: signal peptidase II [Gammaproteobacteria bacterium]
MLKWLGLSVAVIVLDQITKLVAVSRLELHVENVVLPYFNLTLARNTGAAFSFLSDSGGWQRWLFTGLALAVSVVIVAWLKRLGPHEKWTAVGLSLILGGAIGNVIDRVRYGYVVDFLDVYYGSYHWPTFNVADSAITVGAAALIIHSLFARKDVHRPAR